MAARPRMQLIDPRVPDTEFVGRFIFDVLTYTLRTCGFTVPIIAIHSRDNDYSRPNFVKIARVSALRMCLVMRDEWSDRLRKLPRESVNDNEKLAKYLNTIVQIARKEGEEFIQLNVEVTLAMCNEIALFFFRENIPFDLLHLVGTAVWNIVRLITPNVDWNLLALRPDAPRPNVRQLLETLFPDFGNVWEISLWLENFTYKHAVPYGSRINVTRVFYREVKRRWAKLVENEYSLRKPSDEEVKINLGLLPKEVYNDIAAESSIPMPSYSKVAWGYKPSSSKRGAVGGKESRRRQSTASGSSKQTGQGSKDLSKGTGQGSKDSSKGTGQGSKDSSKGTGQGSKDSSKGTGQGSKDSSKETGQGSKDSSKETGQGGKSSEDPEEELTDILLKLKICPEESSQASQGAISKRRDQNK